MLEISDAQFQSLIDDALKNLKTEHANNIKNVAILFSDEPDAKQREELRLLPYQSLYGLYQGIPLTRRQGNGTMFPDRITLFKLPMLANTATIDELKEQIRHTLWHEIAHYYGLNHDRIHELE